ENQESPSTARRVFVLYIEFVRRQRGLSQIQLAHATRVRQSFISQIERGAGIPSAQQHERLAVVLNIRPDLLLKPVDLEGALVEGKPVVTGTETTACRCSRSLTRPS